MKTKNCIFIKMISVVALGAIMGGAYIAHSAHAAIDRTGCDDERNLYIAPELALCSTHVYNIGDIENKSANVQLTRDVVALKTTLITQQMYSQYEILETTVKRLRTQLQKEILLAKLKAASGSSDSSSSSSGGVSSSDKYVVLANAENCLDNLSGTKAGLECLVRNLSKVVSAVSSGNVGDAKRQLEKDLDTANMYNVTVKKAEKDVSLKEGIEECKELSSKRDTVTTCARKMIIAINNKLETLNRSNTQQRSNQYSY